METYAYEKVKLRRGGDQRLRRNKREAFSFLMLCFWPGGTRKNKREHGKDSIAVRRGACLARLARGRAEASRGIEGESRKGKNKFEIQTTVLVR